MPTNVDRETTAEQIKDLLAAPRLVKGESEEAYWKWWSAFVEEYKPRSLSEWFEVNDLAHKQWEQDRLWRCNSAMIEGALFQALKNLVRPFCDPIPAGGSDSLLFEGDCP